MDRAGRIRSLLGIAQRAHCIASGRGAAFQAMANGTAKLLIIAKDAEESSTMEYEDMAKRHHVPFRKSLTREQLGACLGKEYRAAAAVLDDGFRESLEQMLGDAGT